MYKKNHNLFDNLPNLNIGEEFITLLNCDNITIERIVSSKQPNQTIYNQAQNEWVILIEGVAKLAVENKILTLKKGDYIFIKSHTPHQVIQTSSDCIWLAVHIYPST